MKALLLSFFWKARRLSSSPAFDSAVGAAELRA